MNRLAQLLMWVADLFYFPFFRKIIPRDTFRYAACGAFNMFLDSVYYYIAYHFIFREQNLNLGFVVISPEIAALIIVFPITFFNGFWLNRNVAFRNSPVKSRAQFFRYTLSVGGSILLTYGCMKLFIEVFGIYPTPSKMLTNVFTVTYSYCAAKYFTFRGSNQNAAEFK